MDQLIFFINKVLVSGSVLGSVYALGAVGVTLIFGILRFAHFAHGDMMTMGAFIAFVLAAIIALGLDKAFYAPLRKRGARPVTLLIASIGVTLMIQGVLRLFFGVDTRSFFENEPKTIFRFNTGWIGGSRDITFTQPELLLVIVTIVLVLALHFFLSRSRLGKAMRAMSDNADLAQVSGINTALVVRVTWIIAGGLACCAGTMLAIFAAAIVGGLGQAYGAIAGGFLLGFAETLAVFDWSVMLRPLQPWLPFQVTSGLALVPTEYKLTVSFVILVIVLLARPTGIFKGASS
jgi:branched-chain amino acid transport system permease protein